MEVGQSSPFGSGHIWMETWSSEVAKSIHNTIMGAATRNGDRQTRTRSSSFNDGTQLVNCRSKHHRSSFCGMFLIYLIINI